MTFGEPRELSEREYKYEVPKKEGYGTWPDYSRMERMNTSKSASKVVYT